MLSMAVPVRMAIRRSCCKRLLTAQQTAKIKLEKFREIASSTEDIKLDVYDDKDNVIGTFQLQCNDTEKS